MTCRVQNLTHRIVSIRGNSGQTWHLPPDSSLDLPAVDVTENDKITKLVANGVLALQQSMEPGSSGHDIEQQSSAHQEGA